jgi:hypothetical protein
MHILIESRKKEMQRTRWIQHLSVLPESLINPILRLTHVCHELPDRVRRLRLVAVDIRAAEDIIVILIAIVIVVG